MSEKNIDAFCVDHKENYLYAANKIGEILTIDIDTFKVVSRKQIHNGSINAIAIHPKLNYLAALGNDSHLSILKLTGTEVKILHYVKIRNIKPEYDFFRKGPTTSQAIAFHHEKLRIASRGGTAGIFEIEFDENTYKVLHCLRAHDNHDPFTVCYLGDGDKLISGSNSGGGTTLSENGKIINKWFHESAIHWYEPIERGVYLVASDAMKVLRMNFYNDKENIEGPVISKDHLEHVTYNSKTGKAYTSAFDRNILEIDPVTCEGKRLVWKAPFKCRWIKSLRKYPQILIVQCRNGGLYKINEKSGKIIAVIKETLDAQWSAVIKGKSIIIAGEGNYYLSYQPYALDKNHTITNYAAKKIPLVNDNYTYTKRICVKDKFIAFGRTSGEVILDMNGKTQKLCSFNSAIRDIDFYQSNYLFAACEDGGLYKVNIIDNAIEKIFQSDKPLWSIAVNEDGELIAFSDRTNQLYLFDVRANKITKWAENFSFTKRMKWKDIETLWFVGGSILYECKVGDAKKKVIFSSQNTIEDFAWDQHKNYLVVLSYTRYLYLCDFETGEVLHQSGDQIDYSKGILFLDAKVNPSNYKTDFIVFGRLGKPTYNRIHDDRIISYGFIN